MSLPQVGQERRLPTATVQEVVDRVLGDRASRTARDLRRRLATELRATSGVVPPEPWLSAVSDEAALGHRYVIGRPDPSRRAEDPPLRLGWDLVRPWPWTDPEPAERGREPVDGPLRAPQTSPSWARALAWALVAVLIARAWSRRGGRVERRLPS